MRRIILAFSLVLSCFSVKAYDFTAVSPSGHTLRYMTSGNIAYVRHPNANYTDPLHLSGELIIPASVSYGSHTFTVAGIDSYGFTGDSGLTSVVIPSSIEYIGVEAFLNCTGLENISIPNTVTSAGHNVFGGCTISQPVYNSTLFFYLPSNYVGSYTVPTGIITILYGAMDNCVGLTAVVLPNTVTKCECNFNGCVNLNTIVKNDHLFAYLPRSYSGSFNIPDGIKVIECLAFEGCANLTEVTIPRTIETIRQYAFANCTSLTTINYFADSAFVPTDDDGSILSSLPIFANDSNLVNINIGNNVKTLMPMLFLNCKGITNISIPDSVEYIGWATFGGCSNLRHVEFPDSLKIIDDNAFRHCISLDSIVLPNSLIKLGTMVGDVFSNCSSLSSINIPINIDTLYSNFVSCSNLRNVSIDSRHLVSLSTFSNLHHIILGDSVEMLPNNLFNNCSAIQDIMLYCTNPPIIQPNTFNGITTNVPIIIPCGMIDAYRNAPYWNLFTNYTETACPELCMVSVEGGHNVLFWNNEQQDVIAYNLYRESVVAGEYELLAIVSSDSVSRWVDSTSRPNTRSYRYKISITDTNGNESALSHEHKTMHLTINQGLGGRWNLQWTPYEGAEYTTYIIYRGTTADSLEQIDIMPADGNTSYTDETATEGDVFYQVGIVMANSCTSMEGKTASVSRSNIATNGSTQDISDVEVDGVSIFCERGRIVVNGSTDEVRVFDMVGRNVRNETLPAGVYMVKIGNHPIHKVVVVR